MWLIKRMLILDGRARTGVKATAFVNNRLQAGKSFTQSLFPGWVLGRYWQQGTVQRNGSMVIK